MLTNWQMGRQNVLSESLGVLEVRFNKLHTV